VLLNAGSFTVDSGTVELFENLRAQYEQYGPWVWPASTVTERHRHGRLRMIGPVERLHADGARSTVVSWGCR
jgi:hypothetical protein